MLTTIVNWLLSDEVRGGLGAFAAIQAKKMTSSQRPDLLRSGSHLRHRKRLGPA